MALPTPAAGLYNPELHSPRRPEFGPVDMLRLVYTRAVSTARWAAEGDRLFFETNITGRLNIWHVPAEGGWPVQLSVSEERTALEDPSPDGRWLLYTQDVGGNEKPTFTAFPLMGGSPSRSRTPRAWDTAASTGRPTAALLPLWPNWKPRGSIRPIVCARTARRSPCWPRRTRSGG